MDYNKFEDRISRWIENDMDIKERKEFEKFLSDHPEYQLKVEEVRKTISLMNEAPSLKVSSDFDSNLSQRLEALNLNKAPSKGFFGFSNQNFAYLTLALGAIFVLTSFLLQSNSAYTFADQDSDNQELLSPSDSLESEEEMEDMKEIDMLNNIDGSFVNDQQ
ncbi:MAG: anti-sigma factor family protein [Candidatus Neomarinimicrobiota bacterium]